MGALKPWARGPFELIRHAEGHLKAGTDFDKRMALISFDNAIEVAITTHLRLHPSQRGGKTYPKDTVAKWLANYHSKLEFLFDEYLQNASLFLTVTLDEIIWYHSLRNDLYHAGNGMVPDEHNISGARNSALCVFSVLFDVDAEKILAEETASSIQPVSAKDTKLPASMLFLESFIRLERILSSTAQIIGPQSKSTARPSSVRENWRRFTLEVPGNRVDHQRIIEDAHVIRNALVHGQSPGVPEDTLLLLAEKLDHISEFVTSYAFSFDILPALKKHYLQWLRPEITSVRIIQREGMVFLEITEKQAVGQDEKITRTELGFIWNGIEKPMFNSTRTASENAELLLEKLDPYGIINCTDLFTHDGAEQVARIYGPPREL
jgi:hypothetical protein